jgi:hypothetical protein
MTQQPPGRSLALNPAAPSNEPNPATRRPGECRSAPTVTVLVAGRPSPPTLSSDQTAEIWGCSPQRLYAEVGTGTLPVEPLALGRRYRWPTVPVAQAVGLPIEIVHQDGDAAA